MTLYLRRRPGADLAFFEWVANAGDHDMPSDLSGCGHRRGRRIPTTPERAAEVMAYLHEVHEFSDTAGENPTPVEIVDESGQRVAGCDYSARAHVAQCEVLRKRC